jgi:dTDP-4-amino-4,6-dideoxygalactose transaminase
MRDLLSRRLHRGDEVATLEAAICSSWDVGHAIAMPQARVGIYFALKGTIKPGDSVIMSPYTIADVVNMVIAAGGRPVFADIERSTCNIDPNEVNRLIDDETGAVLITHLHGLAAEAETISEICRSKGVPLIEDAAQAFGAKSNGRRIGTIGDVGVFSFGTYKNISAWYGGLVVTEDDGLADYIRQEIESFEYQTAGFLQKKIRFGAMTDVLTSPPIFSLATFWIFRFGALKDIEWINRFVRTELDTRRHDDFPDRYRQRLTPYQARLVLAQLEKVDADSRTRIESARIYHEAFSGRDDLILPPFRDDMSHIYTYYPIQHEEQDELLKWLMYRNRDVGAQHLKNCADLDSFAEFQRYCPNARATARSVVLLPTYPRYGINEVEKTAEAVIEFLDRQANCRFIGATG